MCIKHQFSAVLLFVILLLSLFCVVCNAETDSFNTVINNQNTVIELKISNDYQSDSSEREIMPLVSLIKGITTLDLIYVDIYTNELKYKNKSGEYVSFYTKTGNEYLLKEASTTDIAIIYNDISGLIRYCINGQIPYIMESGELKAVTYIASYNDFYSQSGEESIWFDENITSEIKCYNVCESATAEVVALQINELDKNIRIVAGLDMNWYSSVGFDLTLFVDGEEQKSQEISSNVIFEYITANDKPVYGAEFGYKYFSALIIENADISNTKEQYIIVKPFTCVGAAKFYGAPTKINLREDGCEFDNSYKPQTVTQTNSFFTLSDACYSEDNSTVFDTSGSTLEFETLFEAGEIYLDLSCFGEEAAELNVYVDETLITTINASQGRNYISLCNVSEGKHNVKIEKLNNCKTIIFEILYLEQIHIHVMTDTAWTFEADTFSSKCKECNRNITMNKAETPKFMLTFDKDVSTEANQYEGFTVVNPNGYKIGTDTDGDKALAAGTSYFYVDVEQATLASMKYYTISFDLTVSKAGNNSYEISLLTLISNFRNGNKVSGKTADYEYFLKYNVNEKKLATLKVAKDTSKLTNENSIGISLNTQYKISIVVDNINHSAHVFVDGTYIGKSEKSIVNVTSSEKCYPSFKFNDGGACQPVFDNFIITELN